MENSNTSDHPQPTPEDEELRGSELHMALLAWKNGDITMIELKRLIKSHAGQDGAAVIDRLQQQNYLLTITINRLESQLATLQDGGSAG